MIVNRGGFWSCNIRSKNLIIILKYKSEILNDRNMNML
jgi:hypothetical protein